MRSRESQRSLSSPQRKVKKGARAESSPLRLSLLRVPPPVCCLIDICSHFPVPSRSRPRPWIPGRALLSALCLCFISNPPATALLIALWRLYNIILILSIYLSMTVILGPVQLALLVSRQFPRPAIQLSSTQTNLQRSSRTAMHRHLSHRHRDTRRSIAPIIFILYSSSCNCTGTRK